MSIIYECPQCEDRDCKLNIDGLCHDLTTILSCVPSGMYTCSLAIVDFNRSDYAEYMEDYANK